MVAKYKDTPKRGAGRPSNAEVTERQALIKREIINTLKPYYKPAAAELARLAGIVLPQDKKDKSENELVVENEAEFDKANTVSANVRCTAAKTLMDKFEEAIKELYSKEDYTPAKVPEVEEKPKQSNVSRLSLTVRPKEDKE